MIVMRKILLKISIYMLFCSFSTVFAQVPDTCFTQNESVDAIKMLLYDHGGKSSVDEYMFSSGRHIVEFSTVRNVFIDPKKGLTTTTYWLHIIMTGGRVLNFETKNKKHAIDASKAIKCLSRK